MDSPPTTAAVFLSYARDDAAAARRIAEALRASGLEVWFDKNELRGGDSWDAKIRQQIDACALFIPIISAHTQERGKGYFRLEWKLAVEQTHLMAEGMAFLAPVVIDDTKESGAVVPPEFMRVQWTRLPGALPTPQFVEQVQRLLASPTEVGRGLPTPPPSRASVGMAGSGDPALQPRRRVPIWLWAVPAVIALGVAAFFALRKPESPAEKSVTPASLPPSASSLSPAAAPAADKSAPADKSIAVLPFANMSPDAENAFFADGVHEEVITNLAKIRDLKVISRTSTLVYREATARNLRKIAAELGVANVLEGSVRRAGSKVRVTAQLIDARTDEHIWAETYDGDLTDIFALQARLAREIAAALKATLTAGEQTLIERRPTQNQEAYDLYLRARAMHQEVGERGVVADYQRIVSVYEQAIAKDPAFALAQSQVALVHSSMYWFGFLDPTPDRAERMKTAVDAAVRLAPDAPETHLAVGAYRYRVQLDWRGALAEFRLAAEGLPNDAQLSFWLAITHRRLGRWVESVGDFERSVALNPRDFASVQNYSNFLNNLRRWDQARLVCVRFLGYFPGEPGLLGVQAQTQFALTGNREAFALAFEKLPPDPTDPDSTMRRVSAAMIRGDLALADRILAESSRKTLGDFAGTSVVNDPVAFRRSQVAFLRGEAESARRFAAAAAAYYRGTPWNARQLPWARMRLAQIAALAGRAAEAIPEAEAALADMTAQDAYGATQVRQLLGEIYLMLGQPEKALAVLRQMMSEPCELSPNAVRHDPLWSRLKDDPRFEEILKSAKPL